MPERSPFRLPTPRRMRPGWIAASIVAHLVFVGLIVRSVGWRAESHGTSLSYLIDIPAAVRQYDLPDIEAAPPPPAGRGRPLALPTPGAPPLQSGPVEIGGGEPGPEPPTGRPGGRGRTGPGLIVLRTDPDRRLWTRPMYVPEGGGEAISMDSIVRRRMMAIADSIERNPGTDPNRPPSWTFERDGRTYGLDARGLHLGGITIPSVLLAFLPVPQGNIDQARANRVLAEMRADLLRAAARAEAQDDFNAAVQQIRERWQRERAERRERERREREGRTVPDRPIP